MCSKCEKMRLKRESFYLCFYIFIKGAVIIRFIMDAVLCLDVVRAHPCIAVDIQIARELLQLCVKFRDFFICDILAPRRVDRIDREKLKPGRRVLFLQRSIECKIAGEIVVIVHAQIENDRRERMRFHCG